MHRGEKGQRAPGGGGAGDAAVLGGSARTGAAGRRCPRGCKDGGGGGTTSSTAAASRADTRSTNADEYDNAMGKIVPLDVWRRVEDGKKGEPFLFT